jgi:hypothetical protein
VVGPVEAAFGVDACVGAVAAVAEGAEDVDGEYLEAQEVVAESCVEASDGVVAQAPSCCVGDTVGSDPISSSLHDTRSHRIDPFLDRTLVLRVLVVEVDLGSIGAMVGKPNAVVSCLLIVADMEADAA